MEMEKLFKCVSNLTTKRCGNESIWTNSRGFSFRSTSSENYLASWRIFMTSFGICLLMNNFRLHLFEINEKSGIGFDVIKISFERVVGEVKPFEMVYRRTCAGKGSVSWLAWGSDDCWLKLRWKSANILVSNLWTFFHSHKVSVTRKPLFFHFKTPVRITSRFFPTFKTKFFLPSHREHVSKIQNKARKSEPGNSYSNYAWTYNSIKRLSKHTRLSVTLIPLTCQIAHFDFIICAVPYLLRTFSYSHLFAPLNYVRTIDFSFDSVLSLPFR